MSTLFEAIRELVGQSNAVAVPLYDLAQDGPTVGDGELPVERDESGVPVAWRIFAFGPVSITRAGQTATGQFTEQVAEQIVEYFRQKGSKIPLDSRHFTFELAEKYGVDETQITRMLHREDATFGFVALQKRADGLWAAEAEYHPLAYRLMQEGTLRYFSPVIRGLADGRLRITSVTFTNEPATDGLFSLAAQAEPEQPYTGVDALAASLDSLALSANRSSTQEESVMDKKLQEALASLLGRDSLALSDDGAVPDDVVTAINDLSGEVTANRALRTGVVDALSLEADSKDQAILGALKGLAAKATQADTLKTRVDALELSAEQTRRAAVVERGLESGQLTKAMAESEWGKAQDSVALEAFLRTAPVVVPNGKPLDRDTLPDPDSIALTADEKRICVQIGVSEDDYLAQKKRDAQAARDAAA